MPLIEGAAVGAAIGGLNGLVGWLTIRGTFDREFRTFMIVFMGGMLLRLLLVAAVTFVILAFTEVHRFGYVGGLIAAVIAAQVIEVTALLKRSRKQGDAQGQGSREATPDSGL